MSIRCNESSSGRYVTDNVISIVVMPNIVSWYGMVFPEVFELFWAGIFAEFYFYRQYICLFVQVGLPNTFIACFIVIGV